MIYKYVQNQEEHHIKQTFRDEYLDLLKEFRIEYAEQYIFQELIKNDTEQDFQSISTNNP